MNLRRGRPRGRLGTMFTPYSFMREGPAELISQRQILSNDLDEPYVRGRPRGRPLGLMRSPPLGPGIGGDTLSFLFPFQGTSGVAPPSLSLDQSTNLCGDATLVLLLVLKPTLKSGCAFLGRLPVLPVPSES
jgi:hypothetical protein